MAKRFHCPLCHGELTAAEFWDWVSDDMLKSERARRNGVKGARASQYWSRHNPNVRHCRCKACYARREKQKEIMASYADYLLDSGGEYSEQAYEEWLREGGTKAENLE